VNALRTFLLAAFWRFTRQPERPDSRIQNACRRVVDNV
jgi:hypothetical protein